MYALLSDLHFHKWSAFSHLTPEGLNSRLKTTIDEVHRANKELHERGGNLMVLGGDIFHVRGKISPEVLNPVLECFRQVVESGTRVVGISGNHDLESNDSNDLSSSATALRTVGVEIFNEPTTIEVKSDWSVVLIPYVDNLNKLKETIQERRDLASSGAWMSDLVIHAPVDGVIDGLPDHGLTSEYLAEVWNDHTPSKGRVFAGHYHNHKDFGNGVYSIGATTHQTWSDVDSNAGFLIVEPSSVTYQASHAPSFVDLDPETEKDEVPLYVDGNFVRVTLEIEKESQVAEMRDFLNDCGAAGVLINHIKKKSTISRSGATVKSGASIESSVGEFIKLKKYENQSDLTNLCGQILSEVEVSE